MSETIKNIVIQSGTILGGEGKKSKPFEGDLSGLLTDPLKDYNYDSSSHKPGTRAGHEKHADKSIKEDWQQISKPTRASNAQVDESAKQPINGQKSTEDWVIALQGSLSSDRIASGSRSVGPSRAGVESNLFGKSILPGNNRNSIFDPDIISKANTDPLSDAIISDANKQRKERSASRERARDWETPSIAQTSKDFSPGQMGYTPNRSSHTLPAMPEVRVPEIEAIKEQSRKNTEQAINAASIKESLNSIFIKGLDDAHNDKRTWEQTKSDDIGTIQGKNYSVEDSNIRIAKDFVPATPKQSNIDDSLSGVFTMPEDPKAVDIKRKTNIAEKRTKREDDRSWEKVTKPANTKI